MVSQVKASKGLKAVRYLIPDTCQLSVMMVVEIKFIRLSTLISLDFIIIYTTTVCSGFALIHIVLTLFVLLYLHNLTV